MKQKFEEKYENVLKNIEMNLLNGIDKTPELCDHDMLRVIEHLINYFRFQQTVDISDFKPKLPDQHQKIFEIVGTLSNIIIGVIPLPSESGENIIQTISREELVLCLKRIKKSIEFWTSTNGRYGYINYVRRFIPV